ncbi:SpvB/TcaC N-terminal domain-containing protein [Arcicella lustrica]|uniref:SpvB/TcaC N-terminal domain-containing protein n=1 Tax=Arcicella lustrica TaxID=2984196 RepID=A0ABU5SPN2_9BACT|nr:SpvB/TcaC N-terminal domain-containing protein [Arcicella sp. DC25W]MEA5429122.1 SpvB/TcaC N-terminal domain-containing protein [Arcicella sp. DC25W]
MKKRKLNYILKGLFMFFLVIHNGLGQRDDSGMPYLPNIIPPSPNAASLGKYGDIPVGLYTGLPNISLPIYNISGQVSHAVSLSYHSNGLKVEEVSSNVGLGWSLNAGGVITRTIKGLPDNLPTAGYLNNNVNPGGGDTEICDYFVKQRQGTIDLHPDTYVFNAGGLSGKFLVQKNASGNILGYTLNNEGGLKIEWLSENSWKITDAIGNKYYFGTSVDGLTKATDKTASMPTNGRTAISSYVSAWYLLEIVSANGEVIKFNYETYENTSCQRSGETSYYRYYTSGSGCSPLTSSLNFSETETIGSRLKGITFLNGSISFNYSTVERKDFKGDYPLDNIKIYEKNNTSTPVKTFKLVQSYFESSETSLSQCGDGSQTGKRLKLVSITECDKDNNCLTPHEFSYYEGIYPDRFSYAQDYWGYYNGQNTNTTLIPKFLFTPPGGASLNLSGSYRSPDKSGEFQKLTVLNKIKYPTGGTSSFEYETNTSYTADWPWESFGDKVILGSITGKNYIDNGRIEVTRTFTLTKSQSICDIKISTGGIQCDNTVRDGSCGVELYLSGPVNIPLEGFTTNSQGSFTLADQALPPGTYTLTLSFRPTATNSIVSGFSCLVLGPEQTALQSNNYNKAIGGLRIKSVTSKSCDNCVSEVTNYNYNDDSGNSTGVLVTVPKYDYIVGQTGQASNGVAGCKNLARTSFSQVPMGITQGSHIGYGRIVVTKSSGTNSLGKTINHYTTANPYADLGVNAYPFAPMTSMDWKRGVLTKSEDYAYESNVFKIVKKTEYIYTFGDASYDRTNRGLQVSKPLLGEENMANPACYELQSQIYTVKAGWLHLDQQKTTIYDK